MRLADPIMDLVLLGRDFFCSIGRSISGPPAHEKQD